MANKRKTSNAERGLDQIPIDETLEITISRERNEVVLRNPRNDKVVRLKASVDDDHPTNDAEEPSVPLTPEQFNDGIRRLTELGFAFSPELRPEVVKRKGSEPSMDDSAFKQLRDDYPNLPVEAGLVIYQTLTGGDTASEVLGGQKSFEKKSKTVKEYLIDDDFKADFFFRHALKIPYLENIDWEVVVKTHERGVSQSIAVPYSLINIIIHDSNAKPGEEHQNIAVALNASLVDKLLARLTELRSALDASTKLCESLGVEKSE